MKHFPIERWLDFVHELAAPSDRVAMEQHLASGCGSCGRVVEMLQKLVAAARADAAQNVPQLAVHSARAIFALQRPEKVHILPRMVATLVFDSFRQPAFAGVRSQHKITRQAMYEAGEYCVDLRMEQERGADSVILVGQVANRTQPRQGMANVPIMLMSGKEVLGRALSNSFGEFQMEYRPKKSLRLYVPVRAAGKQIEVRLSDLFRTGS